MSATDVSIAQVVAVAAARADVVEAARVWFHARGNREAPLAAAVKRLEELERVGAQAEGGS